MTDKNIFSKDERIEKILDLLLKYTLGDYSAREVVSSKGDELDAIVIALNALGEEAEASGKAVPDFEKRVGNIMDVLLKFTLFDFSEKIKVGDVGDELDAIAIGLNTMAEELESARKTEKEHLGKITNTNYFLDTILENIPNMVFVKEAKELRFVRLNKAGEELLGYLRSDLIGKNDYDLFFKKKADLLTSKDREALSKNGITDIPEELIDTANGRKWVHTKKIPLLDKDGKPAYLLGISEDITIRKTNEDKIRTLNLELKNNVIQLESTNNELEAFTYSVSHDLRAPLRAIHSYAAILQKEYANQLDEDAKSMMSSVMSNALKMGQLIDDLLSLSRFGKKELQVRETDMTELVKQSLIELKKSTNVSEAKIHIEPLEKSIVDPALMFQVFFNLLSNAVKYSSLKDKPEITISSKIENEETIYIFRDNGSGFDMKYYDKLFNVFQRLHDAHEFEGTGVGLALVKRIVTRHNGRVWAEAEVNKGATFYVALPILK